MMLTQTLICTKESKVNIDHLGPKDSKAIAQSIPLSKKKKKRRRKTRKKFFKNKINETKITINPTQPSNR